LSTTRLLPLSACVLLAACSQSPAQVVLKGDQFYGKSGQQPAAMIARVEPKPAPVHAEPVLAAAPAYSETPVYAAPVAPVREVASAGVIEMKELPPIAAAVEEEAPRVLPEPQAPEMIAETAIIPEQKPIVAQAPEAPRSVGYVWPVRGDVITEFGKTSDGGYNDGINIAARAGEPVLASGDGEVVYAGNQLRGYGNMVIIRHADGIMTAYAHADKMLVKKGEQGRQGETIATVGTSGGVDRAQLHFGVRKHKDPVNPMQYLKADSFASR